jgi:hypothetical protein
MNRAKPFTYTDRDAGLLALESMHSTERLAVSKWG